MTFDPRQAAEEILRKGGKKPNGNGSAQPNGHDQSRVDSFTDVELMGSEVAEPIFIVPGLIPEGLTILAGRPKMGKTTFAMNIADAVARGGVALGSIRCQQNDAA